MGAVSAGCGLADDSEACVSSAYAVRNWVLIVNVEIAIERSCILGDR